MKHTRWLSLLIVLGLTACRPGGSSFHCDGDICIRLEVAEPVKALEPVLVTVTVKTAKAIPGLGVSLISRRAGALARLVEYPENAKVTYQDDVSVDWRLDTVEAGIYTFSAYVIFDQPGSYGVVSRQIRALATHPSLGVASDAMRIYLDTDGNQVDASKARKTTHPVKETVSFGTPPPTSEPTSTRRPTWTPTPIPSLTPTRTPSPTRMMGYPARTLVATPTLSRAYPEP